MKAAGGGGGLIAGPKRKPDAMAAVRGHSGFLNDEKFIRRLREQLGLVQSVSEIKSRERLAKKAKTEAATGELFDVAPKVLTKLRNGWWWAQRQAWRRRQWQRCPHGGGLGAEGGSDDAGDRDFDRRGRCLLVG